ncbi:selenium metabolism-associated LysR family transcriptional regulator [Phosphitispora sp. TUW77]|uniref:selenium metabolism-associated LysR family transcriptional regulator n=1 Tax=Phosphitispora sp. TUW77 TaxID=3152361 RepID=UPI003AB544E1
MFSLRQLKAFVLIVENKSFTKAAKKLYMTQPAISAQIKALEERMEVQLLERTDKSIILTEAGQLFYEEAGKILLLYEGFMEAINELKGVRRGRLLLSASTIPGEYIMPMLMGEFSREYPGIELSLKIADTGVVIQQLIDRDIDIGIIGAPVKHNNISMRELVKDELILISPVMEEHRNLELTLDELVASDLILREQGSGTRMIFHEKLEANGVDTEELQVVMELGSTRAIITAVESGLGLSVVSRISALDALRLGKVKEVKVRDIGNMKRSLYLAWNQNRYLSYSAKAFLNYIDLHKNHVNSLISGADND